MDGGRPAGLGGLSEEANQHRRHLRGPVSAAAPGGPGGGAALLAEKAKALPQTPGNLCLFEDGLDGTGLRVLANAGMERCGGICAVFAGTDQAGYRYAMGSQTVDLRAKAKALHQALGGKGGGQPTLIQGAVTASRQEILAYFR